MKRIIGVSIAAAVLMAVAVAPKTESETIYHHKPLTVTIEAYTDTATGTYIEPEEEPEIEFNGELVAVNVFPEPTPEPEPVYQPTYTTNDGWQYYGVCTITHYCTGHCCNGPYTGTASGAPLTPYRTCASGELPFGTEVLVNGEVWIVQDRGVSGMWLDLCVASHEEAVQRGMFQSEVWIR